MNSFWFSDISVLAVESDGDGYWGWGAADWNCGGGDAWYWSAAVWCCWAELPDFVQEQLLGNMEEQQQLVEAEITGWFCDWGETGLIMSTFRYRLLLHVMYYAAFDTAGENLVQVKWWSWEILYQTQNYIQHSVALPGLTPNFSNWQKTRPQDSSM